MIELSYIIKKICIKDGPSGAEVSRLENGLSRPNQGVRGRDDFEPK